MIDTTCLMEAGLITAEEKAQLDKALSHLPHSQQDLLALIAAMNLTGMSGGGGGTGGLAFPVFTQPPLGTAVVASASNVDPQPLAPFPGANTVLLTPLTNNIIFRLDSINPTATEGHFAAQGSNMVVYDIDAFRFASWSLTPANVFISYFAETP